MGGEVLCFLHLGCLFLDSKCYDIVDVTARGNSEGGELGELDMSDVRVDEAVDSSFDA